MLKEILVGTFVVVSLVGCQPAINDKKLECVGTKDGTISKKYSYGSFEEMQCKNGKKHGFARVYWPNKSLAMEFNFKNGIQHGNYISNHRNGKLKMEGTITNGKNQSVEKHYSKNGKLSMTRKYKDGKYELIKSFYDDGSIQAEIKFEDGFATEGYQMKNGKKVGLTKADFKDFGLKYK